MTRVAAHTRSFAPLSDSDFRQLSQLVKSLSGIDLPPRKKAMAAARLGKRLAETGTSSFAEYDALLKTPRGQAEFQELINCFTTNVTRFNREPNHFTHFRGVVLPDLVAAARRGREVRIWSAGCSTGEEPYELAMCVLSGTGLALASAVSILATDIDDDALRVARAGEYSAESLAPLDKRFVQYFFRPPLRHESGTYRVTEAVRRLVSFKRFNLNGLWPIEPPFDVIMCRNVTIYFDEETSDTLWNRFVGMLRPGGLLYVGHSERLDPETVPGIRPVAPGIYIRRAEPVRLDRPGQWRKGA